ncbi:RsmB/NOP family class I SAM-dependent RNA methyltransferase [Candidatus Pacearchaeota archaeon]|nr:RsmB/NOP family class I SAM-dependent RNA methyltransferase [Candidatus Pacearchaeota archaeon]
MARPEMKERFAEQMHALLPDQNDFEAYEKIVHTSPPNWIRCNTLKISPQELKKRLEKRGWTIFQPAQHNPEIMRITNQLGPGELGNALEHLLGYYYVQELSSMLSVIALQPLPGELVFDLCAAPGSKSSQLAAAMQNKGTLIANEVKLDRLRILSATLERCGATNCIMTRDDAIGLTNRLADQGIKADRILLDAPCSGEGTLRSSPKTFLMWNHKVVDKMGRLQKKLIASALRALKKNGTLLYSTCTHSPLENEAVVDFALKNFPVKLETLTLPIKTRPGVTSWHDETYSPEVTKCHRLYPQDNDSEGFFLAKLTLLEELA